MPRRTPQSPESDPAAAAATGNRVLPVVEEEIYHTRRQVKTGSVRVEKRVVSETKEITAPLIRDIVEVRRVPRNRIVQTIPPARQVGSTLIIPVIEEQIVITKHMILKEEIHVVKRRVKELKRHQIPIAKETVQIVRLDADGNVRPEPRISPSRSQK